MKNVYYLKFLYFNAGKTLMTHNFVYLKNLVNKAVITNIYQKYIADKKDKHIIFSDLNGSACHILMEKTAGTCVKNDSVFILYDDETDGCISGLFCPHKNLFIYNDRYNIFNCEATINTGCRYFADPGRKYSAAEYISMARDYFEKSNCIDIAVKL